MCLMVIGNTNCLFCIVDGINGMRKTYSKTGNDDPDFIIKVSAYESCVPKLGNL